MNLVMLEGPAITDIRIDGQPADPAAIVSEPAKEPRPGWREQLDETARRRNFKRSQGRLLPMHMATATRLAGSRRRGWLARLLGWR
ncbi:hypothetical protein [Hypericibacter sp.]|uniref:hypothetical protein n=1 Tax=Hypericibacter sp. TaxID=2705401 RepID=UPI003D6CCFA1